MIRHDVDEIRQWPDMKCRHVRHPQAWTPQELGNGTTRYPSKEETDYMACLAFHNVCAASAWACKVGEAKIRVPRTPPME